MTPSDESYVAYLEKVHEDFGPMKKCASSNK
jgi:hypothetical protein